MLPGEALDPTLALAFFFDGLAAFRDFVRQAEPFSGPAAVARGTAMFSFAELVHHEAAPRTAGASDRRCVLAPSHWDRY